MSWWKWMIIGIVAFIVLGIIFSAINKKFIRNYGISLYGGAMLTLISFGLLAIGIFVLKCNLPGIVCIGLCAVLLIFVLIYDVKKCGGAGLGAFVLQIIFCVAGLLVFIDLLFNRGRSSYRTVLKNERNKNDYRNDRNGRNRDDRYY